MIPKYILRIFNFDVKSVAVDRIIYLNIYKINLM